MRSSFLFLMTFWISNVWAQRQADNLVNGPCFQDQVGCAPPYANSVFKFNDEELNEIIEPLNLKLATYYSRAAYSDAEGNFSFASNGWRLVNNSGIILSNKLWFDWIAWPQDSDDSTMVINSLGPLFLNDPGSSERAYLFYGQYKTGNFGPNVLKADIVFTYAYLDVPNRALISQNNVVMNDTSASGDMQACRHANGRDWWLIKPGIFEDEYFIGLLSPSGISEMQKFTIPGINHRGQFETYSYFSFDGLKFLHFTGKRYKYLHEYDFDRCTGNLSNPVVHDLTDSIPYGDHNACNISPDGTKLYIRRSSWPDLGLSRALLQYDLNSSNWTLLSTTITNSPQLAPNGKEIFLAGFIVENDTTVINTLCRIRNPNLSGFACDFVVNSDTTQNVTTFVSPSNFANFRLGPIDGSSCDTLGINNTEYIEKPKSDISIYPNPSKDILNIRLLNTHLQNPSIYLFNAQGAIVYEAKYSSLLYSIQLKELNFSSGLYWVKVINGNESFVRRFVVE